MEKVTEELVDEKESVCLNDSRGNSVNVNTGSESVLDSTLESIDPTGVSKWEV